MSHDPRTYNVQELRALAAGTHSRRSQSGGTGPDRSPTGSNRPTNRHCSDAVARSTQFKTAFVRQRGLPPSPATRGRPFLETLPAGPVAETTVTDWLGYLVDGGGCTRAADALAYYRQIEWVSPTVESALGDRLAGFDDPQYTRPLNVADHRVGLVAIQRLVSCARQPDPHSTPDTDTNDRK